MNPFVFMFVVFGGLSIVFFKLCRASSGGWSVIATLLLIVPVFCLGNALHELSHAIGVLVFGGKITDVHLVPNFFKGDFVAYVKCDHIQETPSTMPFIILAPYLVDIVILGLVLLVLPRVTRWNQVVLGGVILFALVRPLGSLIKEGCFLLRSAGCDFGDLVPYVGNTLSIVMVIGLFLVQLALCAMICVGIRRTNC